MVLDPKRLIIFLLVFWLSIIISPLVFDNEKSLLLCDNEVSLLVPKDNTILSFNCRFPPWINTSPAVFVIPTAVVKVSPVTFNPSFASTLPEKVTWAPFVWFIIPPIPTPPSTVNALLVVLLIVTTPDVTSKPEPISTFPPKVTWPVVWVKTPVISKPEFTSTFPPKMTWPVVWFKSPVISKPESALTLPPKVTWPAVWVIVLATSKVPPIKTFLAIPTPPPTVNAPVPVLLDWVVSLIVTTPAVTSKPEPASTLPAKVTWPPVVCVIAWLVIVNAPPAISRPEFTSTFPPKVTWPDVWLIVLATPKVPPIKTFSPIPTPPSTVNAPVDVEVDVVELFIDVIPFVVTVPRTKRSPVAGSNVKVAPPPLSL